MADPVAITGIVVSGVVGPSVTAWWSFRHLRHQHANARVLADRAELRVLLAEATRDLSRAGRIRGAVQSQFMTHGASTVVDAKETVENFHEATREADLHGAALTLRLGSDHPVPKAYDGAVRALVGASSAVTLAHGLGAIDLKEAWTRLKESDVGSGPSGAEYSASPQSPARCMLTVKIQCRHCRRLRRWTT